MSAIASHNQSKKARNDGEHFSIPGTLVISNMAMRTRLLLRCSWWNRQESVDDCATTCRRFLIRLRKLYPRFDKWINVWDNERVGLSQTSLTRILAARVNRTDFGNEIIVELGFTLSMYLPDGTTLRIHCGCYGVGSRNSVIFATNIDHPKKALKFSLDIMRLFVDSFCPDCGDVYPNDLLHVLKRPDGAEVLAGWITYLSNQVEFTGKIPANVTVEELAEGQGRLLSFSQRFIDESDADGVKMVQKLMKTLAKAKLRTMVE